LENAPCIDSSEEKLFETIAGQRALLESARHKTLSARRKAQKLPTRKSPKKVTVADDEYASSTKPVEPYKIETWDD
jgi:hypothetical protein